MNKRKDRIDKKWVRPPFGLLWKTEFEYKLPYSLQEFIYRLKKVNGESIEDFHVKLQDKSGSPSILYFSLTTRNLRLSGDISGMAEKLDDGTVIIRGYTGVDGFPLGFITFGFPIIYFIMGALSTDIGIQIFIFVYILLVIVVYLYGRYLKDELAKKMTAVADR